MIRIALAGYGHWGANYFRILQMMDEVTVVSVCDREKSTLQKITKQFLQVKTVTDFSALLEDSTIQALVIATPASSHHALVKKALLAGKHVLVEKPLALTVEDASELVLLATEMKKILMVGHTFLYNPAVRKMKDCVQKGILGKIYYLQAVRTHLGLIRSDVSAFWDLAPHDVSIFSYLLEKEPVKVSALGTCYLKEGLEDVVFVNLFYDKDLIGHIHTSWVDANKLRQVSLIGSKARIVFDDLNPLEKLRIFEKGVSLDKPYGSFGEFQLLLRDGDIISPKVEAEEPLRNVCLEFIDCIRSGKKPLADGMNGLQVVRTMCAIQQSIECEGEPVSLIEVPKISSRV